MTRFLHIADLHLDSRFSGLSPSESAARRSSQRQAFSRALEFAEKNGCGAVLICGDLFDSEFCTENTLTFLSGEFSRYPKIKFVISPGNHDPYSSDSPYLAADFPDNVFIFKDKKIGAFVFPDLNLTVYGYAFTSPAYYEMPLEDFRPDENQTEFTVLCAHTETDAPFSPYAPITKSQLAASGFDYAALGHIHAGSEISRAGQTVFAYCGCAEGRDFSECGEKGGLLVTLSHDGSGKTVQTEKAVFSERIYTVIDLDISSLSSDEEIANAAVTAISPYRSDSAKKYIIRLKLRGTVSNEPESAKLTELLSDYGVVEVVDDTVCLYNYLGLENDYSVRGQFYRQMLPHLMSEDKQERKIAKNALKYGLYALAGKELEN